MYKDFCSIYFPPSYNLKQRLAWMENFVEGTTLHYWNVASLGPCHVIKHAYIDSIYFS